MRVPLKAVLRELDRRGDVRFAMDPETKKKLQDLGREVGKYGNSVWKMEKEYRDILAKVLKATRGTKYENYALQHIKSIDKRVRELVGEIYGVSQMCYNISVEGVATIDKL